jgi:hypothetical protein
LRGIVSRLKALVAFRRSIPPFLLAAVIAGLLCVSPAAEATTVNIFSPISGTLGPIPDGGPAPPPNYGAPLDVKLNVIGLPKAALSDLQVIMSFSPMHTWAGDVNVQLIAPDGTTRTIFARTRVTTAAGQGDASDLSGPYTFTDTASAPPSGGWWQAAFAADSATPIAAGIYRTTDTGGAGAVDPMPPTSITPSFAANTNLNGVWTMRFRDALMNDTGTVDSANLVFFTISAPVLTSVTPTGPANDNNPEILGTAEELSTVRFYTTPDCSGAPVASGPASALSGPGITVPVSDDSTTLLRATATDGSAHVSPCSDPITYVEDSTAPDALIKKKPKKKTKKKKVTIKFASAEPGAAFECSLNGDTFARCSSPDTVKSKKGKNTFEVRARDVVGNVGSPAHASWKFKKKKEHH